MCGSQTAIIIPGVELIMTKLGGEKTTIVWRASMQPVDNLVAIYCAVWRFATRTKIKKINKLALSGGSELHRALSTDQAAKGTKKGSL
jgi:hypothetical protein